VLKDAQLVCDFVSAQGIAGFDAPQQVTGALTFNCSDAAVVFARDLWRQHAAKNAPRIVIHPTSRWLFKCWSDQNVAALADRLQVGLGASVVLTTGPDAKEIARGKAILALSRSAPRACLGNLTIEQLAAAIQQAHLFIGVDSAPMHLAAAVGTPVVALFGPSLEALWHPWTTHHILLRQPCPCILANQIACDKSRTVQCMAALSVEEVFNAAAKLLSRC
jgi:heptosyltransferase-3